MTKEENIKNDLIKKFPALDGKVAVKRARRISMETRYEDFQPIFEYAINNLGFTFLCTITGLDETPMIAFIYHLAQPQGVVLNIKTAVPKADPIIKSVTRYFADADIYERELEDLLGVKVQGLPEGQRYPLPDNWPAG